MKRSTLTLFVALFLTLSGIRAQSLNIDFSESITYDKENKAFAEAVAMESEDKVFVLLGDGKIVKSLLSGKVSKRLQSFDKKTMKPGKSIDLSKNLGTEDARFYAVMGSKNGFIVFSEERKGGDATIYATRYSWDMQPVLMKKKVFVYEPAKMSFSIKVRPGSDEVAFMTQRYVEEGEPISVDYSVHDIEFEFVNGGRIDLPILRKEKKKGLFNWGGSGNVSVLGDMKYTSKGELLALVPISPEEDEPVHFSLMFVDAKTNEVTSRKVELSDGAYFETERLILLDDELIVTGFYSNAVEKRKLLSKKKGASSRIDGTFFKKYSVQDGSLLVDAQAPFDKDFIFNINSQNPAHRGWFSKTVKNVDEEDISNRYQVQRVFYNEGERKARFFCEYVYNYVTTTTDSRGNTRTEYHSVRGNLFYYEISLEDGKMTWGNSIRKYAHYSSGSSEVWYRTTMEVLPGEKEDVILYLTQRVFNERDKDDVKGEKIKTKKFQQDFVTAAVNKRTGNYELTLPRLASDKVDKEKKVQLDLAYWSNRDQALYTINKRQSLNWGFTALSCALTPVCGVGMCLWYLSPAKRMNEHYTLARITQK